MGIDRWIDGWMHRNRQILIFLHPIASQPSELRMLHCAIGGGASPCDQLWFARKLGGLGGRKCLDSI